MRTLCPNCATAFRITPDQLRARNGMVRCGQCQSVFNAFDSLIEEAPVVTAPTPVLEAEPASDKTAEAVSVSREAAAPVENAPAAEAAEVTEVQAAADAVEAAAPRQTEEPEEVPAEAEVANVAPDPIDVAHAADETPEESAQAARDAGLAAVRELSETPGYNRWAAGTLGGDPAVHIDDGGRRLLWPSVVVVLALSLGLLAQLAYFYRVELVQRLPDLRDTYAALDIDIPLPRMVDLVTIEASDLQADAARGLLVLQATLKNRATHAQAWPALELTLTDSNDAVVVRKILQAGDYLPPKVDSKAFAGNSEVGLKLWLESKQPAAGYRLYVFYP